MPLFCVAHELTRHDCPCFCRVVESTLRSLNNLLERFHQSFFFYLLPSSWRYISIGVYMPPFMVMACGLVLSAIALWLETGDWMYFEETATPILGM